MRLSPWWFSLAVVASVSGWMASGLFMHHGDGTAGAAPPPPAAAPLTKVRVIELTAEAKPIEIVVQGRTAAARKVEIKAETVGRVAEIGAERGARVKKGQLIVRLATDDRQARLEEAQALVRHRQLDFDAGRQLTEKGFRPEFKHAESRAALESAKALLARIDLDIQRTQIRAPFDGVLDQRPVEIGDYVRDGIPIAVVVDLSPAVVMAQISEREVGQIRLGQAGSARLVTGGTAEGVVRYIGAVGDPATRTFKVELEVANPEGRIVEGMTAELRLPVAQTYAHALPPSVLTLDDLGRIGVKLVVEGDKVAFVLAQVIAGDSERVWLTGLPKTARVIAVGQEFVKDGERVAPQTLALNGSKS
ncbi:MAG: efflux RND transporter periplasmic adaptor subunit [Alphaproteobacteria bacterium]|nr:efflux RND transporter periplasmic adaptor subunit [Alphaproteobacteria bacterium]